MQKNYPVVKCSDFRMATEYQRKSPLFGHLLTNWFKKTQIKWAGFWMASEYQTCIQIHQSFQYLTFTSPVFGCFWYSGFLVIGFPFYLFQIWFTKSWRKEHEFPFFNNKAFSHVQGWDSPMFTILFLDWHFSNQIFVLCGPICGTLFLTTIYGLHCYTVQFNLG